MDGRRMDEWEDSMMDGWMDGFSIRNPMFIFIVGFSEDGCLIDGWEEDGWEDSMIDGWMDGRIV